jgi:large subunit ribosomal protein L22
MDAYYLGRDLLISPRKLRLLVNQVKHLAPSDAVARLKFLNTKSARILTKALRNALSNAQTNLCLLPETLKIKSLLVSDGSKIKRMDKSHGARFARGLRLKRRSRLTIILSGTSATITNPPLAASPPAKSSKIKINNRQL